MPSYQYILGAHVLVISWSDVRLSKRNTRFTPM